MLTTVRTPVTVDREPVKPAESETAALSAAANLLNDVDAGALRLVGADGRAVELSGSVVRVLRQAMQPLADRRVVIVSSLPDPVCSTDAARLLGMPHAALLTLLAEGAMPSASDGGLPRIAFDDLVDYKRRRDAERRRILDEMLSETQELEALEHPRGVSE